MSVNFETSLLICTGVFFVFVVHPLKGSCMWSLLGFKCRTQASQTNMKTILPRGPFSSRALSHDLHHGSYMFTFSIFSEYPELILTTLAEVQR